MEPHPTAPRFTRLVASVALALILAAPPATGTTNIHGPDGWVSDIAATGGFVVVSDSDYPTLRLATHQAVEAGDGMGFEDVFLDELDSAGPGALLLAADLDADGYSEAVAFSVGPESCSVAVIRDPQEVTEYVVEDCSLVGGAARLPDNLYGDTLALGTVDANGEPEVVLLSVFDPNDPELFQTDRFRVEGAGAPVLATAPEGLVVGPANWSPEELRLLDATALASSDPWATGSTLIADPWRDAGTSVSSNRESIAVATGDEVRLWAWSELAIDSSASPERSWSADPGELIERVAVDNTGRLAIATSSALVLTTRSQPGGVLADAGGSVPIDWFDPMMPTGPLGYAAAPPGPLQHLLVNVHLEPGEFPTHPPASGDDDDDQEASCDAALDPTCDPASLVPVPAWVGTPVEPQYDPFDANSEWAGAVAGGTLTVSSIDGYAADGTPIEDLIDGAAGAEVVVDGTLIHQIPLFAPGMAAPDGLSIVFAPGAVSEIPGPWILGGVQRIERAGADGGAPSGIDDVFLFQGQELVEVGPAPDGGTYYRTKERGPAVFTRLPASDRWEVEVDGAVTTFGVIPGLCGAIEQGTGRRRRASSEQLEGIEDPKPWHFAVQDQLTWKWHQCRSEDIHGNSVLYTWDQDQLPTGYSIRLGSISWGEGTFSAPDPDRPASQRYYEMRFNYESRPDSGVAAGAGSLRILDARLASIEMLAGPSRTPLRTYELAYERAVPSGRSMLREVWEVAELLPGEAEAQRRRLRRFHYHSDWGGLVDEAAYLAASGDGFDQGPGWGAASSVELPEPVRDPQFANTFYGYPTQTFANVNHDALIDIVQYRVHQRWIRPDQSQGSDPSWKPPVCAEDCSESQPNSAQGFGAACSALEAPYECIPMVQLACSRALEVDVFVNVGDLQFVFDEDASRVLTEHINRAGPPTSVWEDLVARVRFVDLNGDGMDDVLAGERLLSDPRADWGGYELSEIPEALPLESRVQGRSSQVADINGDGIPDLVYPPHSRVEQWDLTRTPMWFDEFTQAQRAEILSGDVVPGGACLIPAEKASDSVPRWTVYFGNPDGSHSGAELAIDMPLFGGPRTGSLAGTAMDLPVGTVYPTIASSNIVPGTATINLGEDVPSPYGAPNDDGLYECEVDGETGYIVRSDRLAQFDSSLAQPWTAASGWEFLAHHMRLDDVNGDGCADVSVSIELEPFYRQLDHFKLEAPPTDWLIETLPAQTDGVFSEVFYGTCTGDFVSAAPEAAPPPPLGAPFTRYRVDVDPPVDCSSLPFRGMELGRTCDEPAQLQPWAAPSCQVDAFSIPSFCCTDCGAAFAACSEAIEQGWCTDGFPGNGEFGLGTGELFSTVGWSPPDQEVIDAGTLWHPWLRHRYARGVGVPGYGATASPTAGGQWTDIDRDGRVEWLQLCHRDGSQDVLAPEAPDLGGGSSYPDSEYPLAAYFSQSSSDFGVGVGQACESGPARTLGIDYLGMVPLSTGPQGRATDPSPMIGPDAGSFLLDIDGDGFVDHVTTNAGVIAVRLQERTIPELQLVGITYEGGTADASDRTAWTGTAFLEWAPTNPADHPLLPTPSFRLSGVIDGAGYRVWQSFGCRMDERRFLGCQTIVGQGPRGAFLQSLYTTHPDLPARRWLDATLDADGHLVDTSVALLDLDDVPLMNLVYGASYSFAPDPTAFASGCCSAPPAFEPYVPPSSPPPPTDPTFDPAAGDTDFSPSWRACAQTAPSAPASFDATLGHYVEQCAGFSTPSAGPAADLAEIRLAASQEAWAFPLHDGLVGTFIDLGVAPTSAGSATPADFTVEETEWDPLWATPLTAHRLGWASTIDDDLHRTLQYGSVPGMTRPQLESVSLTGDGAWSQISVTETISRDGAVVDGGAALGAQGEVTSWSRGLDEFGRVESRSDADGVATARSFETACGGLSHESIGPNGRWDSRDAACRVTAVATTTGLAESTLYDGFGRPLKTTTDPGAGQPSIERWTVYDDSPGAFDAGLPQRATTDGYHATFSYFTTRGHLLKERECRVALPELPQTATGLAALVPADIEAACIPDTVADTHRVTASDGRVVATSARDLIADANDPWWSVVSHDSLGRPVSSGLAIGSVADIESGAFVARKSTLVERHHDRSVKHLPDGRTLELIRAPLGVTRLIDGLLQGVQEFRPTGQTDVFEDALGRVTANDFDGLGRPTGTVLPPFVGIDETGAQTTLFPESESLLSPAGRLMGQIGTTGAGFDLLRDAYGRVYGRDRTGPSGTSEEYRMTYPAPTLPGSSDEQVFTISEPDGDAWEYVRDGLGRTLEIRHPDGTTETSWYDQFGRIAGSVDRNSLTTSISLSDAGLGRVRFGVVHPDGAESVTFRDMDGQLLRTVDSDGVAADYEYDVWGRLVREWVGAADPAVDLSTYPSGRLEMEYVYDDLDRLTAECPGGVGSPLLCTQYTFDAAGRIAAEFRGLEEWQFTWRDDGSLSTASLVTPGLQRTVSPVYDDVGRVQGVAVNGDLPGLTWFDVAGRRARYQPSTPNHESTRWVYDDAGRLSEIYLPGRSGPMTYGYWPDGQLQWIEDGDGETNPFLPGAADEWFEYDAMGQQVLSVDARGTVFHREFDGPFMTSTWAENVAGVPLQRHELEWDPAQGQIVTAYTALTEECASLAGPDVAIADVCEYDDYADAQMGWSPGGRRLSVTDANGNQTSWEYDIGAAGGTGQLLSRSSETTHREYAYDGFGRVVLESLGDPAEPDTLIDYVWDDRSRIVETHWSREGGAQIESELVGYDPLDRRVFAEVLRDGAKIETVQYGYDHFDRMTELGRTLGSTRPPFSGPNGVCELGELCFDYDLAGQRTGVTWPDGRLAQLEYANGDLERIWDGPAGSSPTLYEVHARDKLGRPETTWKKGGIWEELTYDVDGQLNTRYVTYDQPSGADSAGPWDVLIDYGYDELGRLVSRETFDGTVSPLGPYSEMNSWGYNAAGWLVEEVLDEYVFTQEFDRVGNRVRRTYGGVTQLFATYGLDNQLLTLNTDGENQTFAYDANGRRLQGSDGSELTYSPRGRLEVVGGEEGVLASYSYGVGGRRVSEATSEGSRSFLNGPDGWLPWVVESAQGVDDLLNHAGSQLLALGDGDARAFVAGPDGSPLLAGTNDGAVAWQGRWDAYGQPLQEDGDAPISSFGGMLASEGGVGLLSAGMRDYDPGTGTWLQMDPMGVAGDVNSYRFAAGDPMNLADPSGACIDLDAFWSNPTNANAHRVMVSALESTMTRAPFAPLVAGGFDILPPDLRLMRSGTCLTCMTGGAEAEGEQDLDGDGVQDDEEEAEAEGGSEEPSFDELMEITGYSEEEQRRRNALTDMLLNGPRTPGEDESKSGPRGAPNPQQVRGHGDPERVHPVPMTSGDVFGAPSEIGPDPEAKAPDETRQAARSGPADIEVPRPQGSRYETGHPGDLPSMAAPTASQPVDWQRAAWALFRTGWETASVISKAVNSPVEATKLGFGVAVSTVETYRQALDAGRRQEAGHVFAAVGTVTEMAGVGTVYRATTGRDWLDDHFLTSAERSDAVGETAFDALLMAAGGALKFTRFGIRGGARGARGGKGTVARGADEAAEASARNAECPSGMCTGDGSCFVAGTAVVTAQGMRAIEDIEAGDQVLAYDPDSGEQELKEVVQTFVHYNKAILELEFEAADGSAASLIEATGDHPFWVVGRGWRDAQELRPGDEVFTSEGGWLRVKGSTWAEERATVYNFEVADFHTYYVGEQEVLVHNSDACGIGPAKGEPGHYTPDRVLPTDDWGVPTADSPYPHTQLGRSQPKYGREPQAREWNYGTNGNLQPTKDIDFTDHGMPQYHPDVPHQHPRTPNNAKLAPKGGFKRGPGEPLEF